MRSKSFVQTLGVLLIALAVTLTGCGGRQVSDASTDASGATGQGQSQKASNMQTQEQTKIETSAGSSAQKVQDSAPVKISFKVYSETVMDENDGSDLVELKITYPEIDNPDNEGGISAINEYYKKQFADFTAGVLDEGVKNAAADKESSKSGGYQFHPHAYERIASISYNGSGLLSVLSLQYENTGGAHTNSFWLSETFDVKTGKKLSLADIFGISKEKALEKVYETVLSQIKETEGTDKFVYNESYKDDVRKNFSEGDFVLTNGSIMFYYQLYAIAPYAAGFRSFNLPLEEAGSLAVNIPALKSNETETEVYEQAGGLIDRNKTAFCEIFGLSMLKMSVPDNRSEKDILFPVTDERFPTFTALEQFVRNTYVKQEADNLFGSGRYQDIDGKLYGDISKDGGMGYYVDWNNYRYEISNITENSAVMKIYVTDDSPAGKEERVITVNMQKENGVWLLEKMFH